MKGSGVGHILLIEPDAVLAGLYNTALQHEGHTVTVTASAGEAIGLLDTHSIDAVVLELQLPLHNGLEFLYELRSYADWKSVPVIIHSFVPPERVQQSLTYKHLAIAQYLHKDHTQMSDLQNAVRQIIS